MYGFLLQLISRYRRQFTWLARNLPWFWRWLAGPGPLARFSAVRINRLLTEYVANWGGLRPYPYSLWGPQVQHRHQVLAADAAVRAAVAAGRPWRHLIATLLPPLPSADYVSWPGLTDRSFTGRHLPPWQQAPAPDTGEPAGMFTLRGVQKPCPVSSALFSFFAQWFTDSFLRTDFNDLRRNTSNHEIDLCQIYGLVAADTAILRARSGGRLKSQWVEVDGEQQELPPSLFEADGGQVREEFLGLSYIDATLRSYANPVVLEGFNHPARRRTLFATGLERGNSTVFYCALSTVFLREHNRVAAILQRAHPDWDDDRLFETARNVLIVLLLKVVVQDYVYHIAGVIPRIVPEPGFAEQRPWYRSNRISAEFDLLYRWHALVPASVSLSGGALPADRFRIDNALLGTHRVGALLAAASATRAGRLTLGNTQPFLLDAEAAAMYKGRVWQLQPFNRYRECFGLEPYRSIADLVDDPQLCAELERRYQGDVDRVELIPGLLAERRDALDTMGETMRRMVGADAFSQALTNPLLARAVFEDPATFGAEGARVIAETSGLVDIVRRNGGLRDGPVAFRWHDSSTPEAVPAPLPTGRALCVYDIPRFFVGGWRSFYQARSSRLGSPVFRVAVCQPAIACLDQDAMRPLFDDPGLHQGHGFGNWITPSMPLVGADWPSMFENGPGHDRPKALYRELLAHRRAHLADEFAAVAARCSQRWCGLQRLSLRDGIEDLSMELAFRWLLAVELDDREVAAAKAMYLAMFTPQAKPWSRWLPFSRFDEFLATHQALLARVQASPLFEGFIVTTGARLDLRDRQALAEQVCFLAGMNAFLGLQNHLKSLVGELACHPELHPALRAELAQAASAPLDSARLVEALDRLPGLEAFIREVLRLHPPVTLIYGRASSDRVVRSGGRSFAVRAGELLVGVIATAQRDPARFPAPDELRPQRWQEGARAEDLVWSRGGHCDHQVDNDRRCPGRDDALTVSRLACLWLLGNHDWSMAQRPYWTFRWFSIDLAAPRGALEVVDFRRLPRSAAAAGWWT